MGSIVINGKTTNGQTGAPNDLSVVPYTFGTNTVMDHLNTSYYHVHGQSFVYPTEADDVALTAGSGAWDTTGSITEVVPAATLTTSSFDMHWINVSNISGNGTIEIQIYAGASGSETKIGATRASRTTNQARNGPSRIQIPQQPSGTRISCKLLDSTGGALSCNVSFEGHYYA